MSKKSGLGGILPARLPGFGSFSGAKDAILRGAQLKRAGNRPKLRFAQTKGDSPLHHNRDSKALVFGSWGALGIAVGVLTVAVTLTAHPVDAQEADGPETAPNFESFSAKRVRPPKPGSGRLITIQIDPAEQAARLSGGTAAEDTFSDDAAGQEDTPVAPDARFAWFWEDVSPALSAASPGRLEKALEVIAAHSDVPAPRLQDMQDIVSAYGIDILTNTLGTQVSPAWVLAVIAVESSGRADAVSSAGALGLMQLMPETAVEHGVTDAFVPKDNIAGGVRFIDQLMTAYGGDPVLVAAAYNAGPGAVRDNEGVPPYAETRDYVPKVLAAYQIARSLCRTPPIMISDGCIFHSMN